MLNKNCLLYLIKNTLPLNGKLMILRKPYKKFAIKLEDIDYDGTKEIVAYYKIATEKYALVLKDYYGLWCKIADYKLSCTENKSISNTTYTSAPKDPVISKCNETTYMKQNKPVNHLKKSNSYLPQEKIIDLYSANIKTSSGENWGFINSQGDFVIKPYYDHVYNFQNNGLAIVGKNGLYGVIDTEGNWIVAMKYETINQFSEGIAIVVDEGNFKVIDESGKELTKNKYNFIGSYSNGRALFSKTDPIMKKQLYGYLDKDGKEIIPAKYENGSDFKNGKAIVKIGENNYALIDTNGKVLNSYDYFYVGNLSEGLMTFQEKSNGNYGYINENGDVVIPPKYTMALPFFEGRAVVNTSKDIENKYGLIDKMGNYIIPPKYNDIYQLGENRIAVGIPLKPSQPYFGSKYNLSDNNGIFLTPFEFNNILKFDKGFASVYDDNNTFFIDKNGNVAKTLPIIDGEGSLYFIGNLISALVDNRLSYYDRNGNLVWKQNTVIPLNDRYSVKEEKFKPNNNYLVYIPQIEGMKNLTVQHNVNKKLKDLSQVDPILTNEKLEYTYEGDFNVQFFKKNLLVLSLDGYQFYFGAAHGMPSKIYPHIDLVTGEFYTLKDLFKEDSDYVKILSDIIEEQINTDSQYNYIYPDSYKGISKDQPFYVDNNNLYIYFTPYEIAPYAAGFPTFKIPYSEIMDIIDTSGSFWRAYHI